MHRGEGQENRNGDVDKDGDRTRIGIDHERGGAENGTGRDGDGDRMSLGIKFE